MDFCLTTSASTFSCFQITRSVNKQMTSSLEYIKVALLYQTTPDDDDRLKCENVGS